MKLSTANDETDGSDAVMLLLKPHLVEKNTHTLFYTLHFIVVMCVTLKPWTRQQRHTSQSLTVCKLGHSLFTYTDVNMKMKWKWQHLVPSTCIIAAQWRVRHPSVTCSTPCCYVSQVTTRCCASGPDKPSVKWNQTTRLYLHTLWVSGLGW